MTNETASSSPSFLIGRVSDAGRSGKNNEDSADTFQARLRTQQNGSALEAPLHVAVVADGIGGNVAGEMASRTAVDTIKDFFRGKEFMAVPDRLTEAIIAANQQIYERAAADPTLSGMGTTVVAAVIAENRLYVAHAGDSRAYLSRNGQLYRLTLDHTWAQEAIEAGRLTPAQAKDHPNRHVIKRFLGISESVDVDSIMIDINHGALDPEQIHTWPKTNAILLQPGDSVILCSDGLTDVVDDERIAATVNRYAPQEAAQRLVDQANKAGGPDNITVVVVQWSTGTPAVIAPTVKRSPFIAVALGLALLLVAGAVGYLLANRRVDEAPAATAIARTIDDTQTVAVAITPTLTVEAATAEPTLAFTETATPSPTVDAQPTATATETAVPTATDAPPTSTPVKDTPQATANVVVEDISVIATTGAEGMSKARDDPEATAVAEAERAALPTLAVAQGTGPGGPTSTPIPDFTTTATATATEPATPTPSRTPTVQPAAPRNVGPTATATIGSVASPSTTSPDFSGATVTLLEPGDGDTVNSARTFSWKANFDLPEGYAYEPVFWKEGQDAFTSGAGYGGTTRATAKNLSAEDLINGDAQTGDYYWGVLLVKPGEEYKRIKYLGGGYRIRIESSSKPDSDSISGPRK